MDGRTEVVLHCFCDRVRILHEPINEQSMPMEHHNFAVIRTPVQSLANAYRIDTSTDSVIGEGIFLSSVDLWNEWQKHEKGDGRFFEKLSLSLSKYWLRSCSRCTPYGTFAGTAVVHFSPGPECPVVGKSLDHTRQIRLDMNYVYAIVGALTEFPFVREQLRFYPNNSIYELPDGYRYAEYTIDKDVRNYQLTSVAYAPYLKDVLECASKGVRFSVLVAMLVQKEYASESEARMFVIEMIQAQLLVSELEPCVSGGDPLNNLVRQLKDLEGMDGLCSSLRNIQALLARPAKATLQLQSITNSLESLELVTEPPKNLLQTDLFLKMESDHINVGIMDSIVQQAEELMCLSAGNSNADLEDFKLRFQARYEDAEVPLAIVMDADLGIGYASVKDENAGDGELIDDLAIPALPVPFVEKRSPHLEQFVVSKFADYLRHGKEGIEITEDEMKDLGRFSAELKFPESMYLMGNLFKKDGCLDKEQFMFSVAAIGGPSAGNLLGRFTYGDEKLYSLTKGLLEAEELKHPDCLFAEVVHLPQARTGNILLRPLLRSYEIPYAGSSGAPQSNQILIEDIVISLRAGEIVLKSRKYNKRIIPRLTTAHNFSVDSLPVYKLLCDLQHQGMALPNAWNWSSLATLKHLPRVSYKNLVVRKARWIVSVKDIADLPANTSEHKSYLESFCRSRMMPSRVVFVSADNELLIDFTEEPGIRLFLHYLRRYKTIQLEEFLFTGENCIVSDIVGQPFAHELIIPLWNPSEVSIVPVQEAQPDVGHIRRKFAPGSEWLYFKIYTGSKTAEKILCETVQPFVEQGISTGLFEHFFFVRFRDEFSHIRIRFYNSDVTKQGRLQEEFMSVLQPLLDLGLIDKLSIDTYSREVERYGSELVECAERIFSNDSLAVLRFIRLLEGPEGERYRFLFALRGIDMLLNDFDLDVSSRHALLKSLQTGYFKESGGRPSLQKQLNAKYRKHRAEILHHMDPENDMINGIEEAASVFRIRSEMNARAVAEIRALIGSEGNDRLLQLLQSYVHMFMNRLFIARQRKYELVVYHFLEKVYNSALAIERGRKALNPMVLQAS